MAARVSKRLITRDDVTKSLPMASGLLATQVCTCSRKVFILLIAGCQSSGVSAARIARLRRLKSLASIVENIGLEVFKVTSLIIEG